MAYTYRGFSTVGRHKKFRLTDFELIRQDLINHFHIKQGEKLMKPGFGTIIWNMLHEPLTEEVRRVMSEDVTEIVNYDPRLNVEHIDIIEHERGIQIEVLLTYLQTNETASLNLLFDGTTSTLTAA
jgi:phage baseplate assembly protein W